MNKLFTNIKTLVQAETTSRRLVKGADMAHLPLLNDAWLLTEGELIHSFGTMDTCPTRADEILDVSGRMIFPCWCDSHTHIVYAGSREAEFVDRIRGLSYEAIARRGGGILHSAARLRATPESVLVEQAQARLLEIQGFGTGAVEIKSGYGLSVDAELKMLRVIRRLREWSPLSIKATFLGAHALPPEFRDNREGYLRLVVEEMLPRIADEGLADYMDVFCEKGFFTVAETERLMEAGARYGLRAKIHTNQFHSLGGIEAAVKHRALSVDHLEVLTEAEIALLRDSDTMPTLLPTAPFFINDEHYPPARQMLDAGLPIALATDYNPGTSPSGRMPFVLSLACIKLRLRPEEVINAATLNGAYAMELADSHGSIVPGKIANLFITRPIPSVAYLPYAFGSDLVERVFIRGQAV